MNERNYYHTALESALLNGKNLKERIDARTAAMPSREEKHIRLSPRLVIALIAAATFLIASATYAAVLLRNQIFKEKTNAVLDERIETVTEPLNVETHDGWQPKQLILYNDVQSIKEEVTCPVGDNTIQLSEIYYSVSGLDTEFWLLTDRQDPVSVRDIKISINGEEPISAYYIDAFDRYYQGHYIGESTFSVSKIGSNPIRPDTTFTITGLVDDVPFTLTYTFTEETYRRMQQGVVDTVNEHKSIVDAIPDAGTEVNYHRDNRTLLEVAVNGNLMYFTEVGDGTMSKMPIPYSEYDSGIWPVIDGRVSEFFSLGVVDGPYEEGVVYSTCLPYPEDRRPEGSLISFEGIVFRYEWATAKVTLPKDEAEYEAWRRESMELSKPYCEEDWIWHFDANGETFGVKAIVFHNHSLNGMIGVVLSSQQQFDRNMCETAEEAPKVSINGVPLVHYGEVDPNATIMGYVSDDGHAKGYEMTGAAVADLPETFVLSVTYQGETVETTLHLSDVIRMDDAYNDIYADAFDY